MPNDHVSTDGLADDAALLERFRPVFDAVAATAAADERARRLPFDTIGTLRERGFTALRVPAALGGGGISIPALFRLLEALAEADPSLVQILRAHFAFVEGQRANPDREAGERWLRSVAAGAVFGAAMAERTPGTDTTATLSRADDGWILHGTKYYCTGTLYSSRIIAVARDGSDRVAVAVPADAPGVHRDDDWDGFGQRTTGSGTTRFESVRVSDADILRRTPQGEVPGDTILIAFYQLFHIAALAGIARAVRRDAIGFVQNKTRTFGVPGRDEPRHDPLVQRVVGRISANVFALDSIVEHLAHRIQRVADRRDSGHPVADDVTALDIAAFEAQQTAIDLALSTTTLLFEVGGASATATSRNLDRHWRNARVLASHNPAAQRERMIVDWRLNGTDPGETWRNAAARNAEG
ncbi:MAG: acyl-CoA dehydrogenase family protein [Gluconacetobacter diazotrophicus]|nr:acyl-CoA dehydrogenase family protein [Gluconacetobacter diazotrophicus]